MHIRLSGVLVLIGVVSLEAQIEDDTITELFGTSSNGSQKCGKEPGYNCIPYYLCTDQKKVKLFGEHLLDVRIGNDDEEKLKDCKQSMDICCDTANTVDTPTIPIPTHYESGCGFRNVNGIGIRITGKDGETHVGEFPWQIAVIKKIETASFDIPTILYECGGSLIHESVVLSVAHCLAHKPISNLLVRAGEWDTQTDHEPLKHQDREVQQVITHENFDPSSVINDAALIITKTPFQLFDHIRPICLPPPNTIFDGQYCIATGWGKEKLNRESAFSVILKKVELPVVPSDQCQEMLRKTHLSKYFILHPGFMCAGGEEGKDTCKGDGGSPLVCPHPTHKDQYYQAGIVAWGIGCNNKDVPGVYVNVAKYVGWIGKNLESLGFSSSSFTP